MPAIQGVDTRALTRVLAIRVPRARLYVREASPDETELESMLNEVQRVVSLSEKDLVSEVSGAGAKADVLRVGVSGNGPHIVAVDCGVSTTYCDLLWRKVPG